MGLYNVLRLSLLFVTCRLLVVETASCDVRGWKEWSLLDRWYQAGVILYGQDTPTSDKCPQSEANCETTRANYREYSNFDVYCVLKNNGPPVPKNITIQPRTYGMPCAKTYFNNGVSGWVQLAMVRFENDKYYWDEINNQSALSTIYVVNTDDKLKQAATLCNLPSPSPPVGGADDECPEIFNLTRPQDGCFEGCQRGWTPIAGSCYKLSDVTKPVGRNEAAASCLLEDADLVSIESYQEESGLVKILNNHEDVEWWTSGTNVNNRWIWEDGITDRQVRFTNWRPSEPSGPRGVEDHIVILYTRTRWGWRDTDQDTQLPFICEKEPGIRAALTTDVCRNVTVMDTAAGRRDCDKSVMKVLAHSATLWPVLSIDLEVRCRGRTAYDDINCLVANRQRESFMTMLFVNNTFNPLVRRQQLNVSFISEPGILTVCGRRQQWTDTVVVRPTLTEMTSVPSWYVHQGATMSFAWEADPGALYTLIILDMALLSVHGAWINIPGANFSEAQVVQEFVPLTVATPEVPMLVAFMLFNQSTSGHLTETTRRMLSFSTDRPDVFNVTLLMEEIGLEELVAVNFLTVTWDAYSAWYYEKQGPYTNHCPQYVQKYYSEIDAPILRTVHPFSLVLNVSFSTGPDSWTMCCKRFSVPGSNTSLDVYGSSLTVAPSEDVRLPPTLSMTKGNVLLDGRDQQQVFRAVCIFGEKAPDLPIDCNAPEPVDVTYDWYTVVMVDVGIFGPPQPGSETPALHWLVIDVPDGDVTSGMTVVPYKVPSPFDKQPHLYVIYVFRQKGPLTYITVNDYSTEDCMSAKRCPFDVSRFMDAHQMALAGASWFSTRMSDYSLKTLIGTKLVSPADACKALYPKTMTFGPFVMCKPPKPVKAQVGSMVALGPQFRSQSLVMSSSLVLTYLASFWVL